MNAPIHDPDYVRPLAGAENEFLQVLVDRFRILRRGHGFELQVGFNESSPAIWRREARRRLRASISREQCRDVQQKLDAFFGSNRNDDDEYDYNDATFPFRLGNGGTLPVVRLKEVDYYCLFYRDTHPTGWNIANGAANTRHDLLHPDAIVERELREELIIVEPRQRRWHVFDWHDARLRDHPDFALAQALWRERFGRQGFLEFERADLPLKWSLPPDADAHTREQRHHDAIRIRCGEAPAVYTGLGFLNLNAEDFGIEFDRIAKLAVGEDCVFCDGELRGDELLNRVVGLFPVESTLQELVEGRRSFVPKRFFWNGEDRTGDDLRAVIGTSLAQWGGSWHQIDEALRQQAQGDIPADPFDLCPVTRTILKRHHQLREVTEDEPPPPDPFQVFLSFASEDRRLARQVFDHLSATVGRRVFFSDLTMTRGGFADQIDHALDTADAFVAVGTRPEHLLKSWVKYEWRNFHNDIKSRRKPDDAPFFAIVAGIESNDLPRPLREQAVVRLDQAGLETALAQAARRIAPP